eukprot:656799-Ditylum_brightwellii.AAC.1
MSATVNAANGTDPTINNQWGWDSNTEEPMEEEPLVEAPMEWQTAKKHGKHNKMLLNGGEKGETTGGQENQTMVAKQIKECGEIAVKVEDRHKTSTRFEWDTPQGTHTFNVRTAQTKAANMMRDVDPTVYLMGMDKAVWKTSRSTPWERHSPMHSTSERKMTVMVT